MGHTSLQCARTVPRPAAFICACGAQQCRRRDIVVGTPGRLLALLQTCDLSAAAVSAFVMDEVDRLLTDSMYDAVAEIYDELPHKKQV